jgi:hypothetical protein
VYKRAPIGMISLIVLLLILGSLSPVMGHQGVQSSYQMLQQTKNFKKELPSFSPMTDDLDPLVDIEVTVDIISIRLLEDIDHPLNPDFLIKVFINSEETLSPVWINSSYLYDIHWTATINVPDDIEDVDILIGVYDNQSYETSDPAAGYTAAMVYSLKTGHWTGDDSIGDPSGYGRLNSCDGVGSANQPEWDCELWFNIYQTDYDSDTIPYWTEVYSYKTDPTIDNTGEDSDVDLVPIEWEFKWSFNPFVWSSQIQSDIDGDGLTNVEEYHMSPFGSDPYRKDLYIEIDVMEQGPLGQNSSIPPRSKELFKTVYDRRNIVCHLDDGCMGGGGETIPFDEETDRNDLRTIYNTFFLHNDSTNWRRSVFRYANIVYHLFNGGSIGYVGEHPWLYWHAHGINTYVICVQRIYERSQKFNISVEFIFACMMLHETGHTFGLDFLFPAGCDNGQTDEPYNLLYWVFENYQSCMNYRYMLSVLDYSDGTHGPFDHDDWSHIDLSFFEKRSEHMGGPMIGNRIVRPHDSDI